MALTVRQKTKLLLLLDVLRSESDQKKPISTNGIISKLNEKGIKCARKTIYEDVHILRDYGYDIITKKSKRNLYYIVDRAFKIPELRILLDAVQTAAFITKEKTAALTEKIAALAEPHKSELLRQTTVCFDVIKHINEGIYSSIDAIDSAIATDKKISFQYFDFNLDGDRVYRRDKERYIVNPVGLIFSNGFYYLVCYNDKRKQLTNYRVDRMDKVLIETDDIIPADCINEFASYKEQNLAFSMFSGEVVEVTLVLHNSLIDIIFDKFGMEVKLEKVDDEHFTTTIKVQISPVFLGWCMMFGDKLKVIGPQNVVDQLLNEIKLTLSQYEK